ncbi:MAG: hypothetical protein MI824_16845 [Hyphomicrobiales bacterium]|nr:hypothetical protein [Hyphomicrobiales bacterium]
MARWSAFGILPAVCVAAMVSGQGALATEAAEGRLSIELNRVSAAKGACRASFVFTNKMNVAVEALSIETVLFNKEGSVERFLVLKSRPLSPKKIRVQQYDIRGLKCEALGRVLLNDVKSCKVGTLTPEACLDRIEPSSRAGVPFISTMAASN